MLRTDKGLLIDILVAVWRVRFFKIQKRTDEKEKEKRTNSDGLLIFLFLFFINPSKEGLMFRKVTG